jgi:transcriptional regulator with XRE-family HTH domain
MSRVERGRGNPSLDAIEVFAIALGVEVLDLFRPVRAIDKHGRLTASKRGKT